MALFDLKVIDSVLRELEEERGIPKERVLEAIEAALATAYKKEYGKRGQIINAHFNPETGDVEFEQVKIVVEKDDVRFPDEEDRSGDEEGEVVKEETESEEDEEEIEGEKPRFNPEHHILLEDAKKIKKSAEVGEEMIFPLEEKEDYGRISAQTAKQVIIQKIREAEKVSVYKEFDTKEGEIISGTVQRVERGNIFVDLGRATGVLPYEEQIPGERFKQGERIRAYLYSVEETPRGIYLRLSRAKPEFLQKLFEMESPEVANGTVEIKAIAREAGSRSKVAVLSHDDYIDPVGSLVGQRGVRVHTVTSELGGERIDIIEWSENSAHFVENALSPAAVLKVDLDEDEERAEVLVAPDQQSLAIGKGGQNARLAAKLTGWRIDIQSAGGDDESESAESDEEADAENVEEEEKESEVKEAEEHDSDEEGVEDDTTEEETDDQDEETEEETEDTASENEAEDDKADEEEAHEEDEKEK